MAKLVNQLVELVQMNESVCYFYVYPHAKISNIAQVSLDILQIQYWGLFLAEPEVPDHTHMSGQNQQFIYPWIPEHMHKTIFITQAIPEMKLTHYLALPWTCLNEPDYTQLK